MSRFEILKKLMRKHRYQLVTTYSLFSLEMLGALLRPFFLGVAVNDLIKGSYHGLVVLSIVHFLWLIMGLDTIPYTVQRITSLADITRRIELQDDDFSEKKQEPVNAKKILVPGPLKLSA